MCHTLLVCESNEERIVLFQRKQIRIGLIPDRILFGTTKTDKN